MLVYVWVLLNSLIRERIHTAVTLLSRVHSFLIQERIRAIVLAVVILLFIAGLTLVPHASVLACSGTGSCVCPGC